ncbi:MAG: hypothetical protein HY425_02855 [Candidatus Levybacteria bacterium]|nr:hypothetical protein [Candidatus Levybacteria bacterium]
MQSFLIIAKDKDKAAAYISNFLKEEGIHSLDIDLQTFEKIMGIQDIRSIQKSILLKPFRGKTKAVIIKAYENITTEAQNAMLKILEEPPANTLIIISIARKELLLPTILSRCKIIDLKEKEMPTINEDSEKFNDILNTIFNGKIAAKLRIAQDVARNTEDPSVWLEKISIFVRSKLAENYNNPKYLEFLRKLQKTYGNIKGTNVSKRVALENLFLSF